MAVTGAAALSQAQKSDLLDALSFLKGNAKTFHQLVEKANFILKSRPLERDAKAEKALDPVSRGILKELTPHLQNASWDRDALEAALNGFAETKELKFGKLAAPLRAALAGRAVSPSVFDMMLILGREETLARIEDAQE